MNSAWIIAVAVPAVAAAIGALCFWAGWKLRGRESKAGDSSTPSRHDQIHRAFLTGYDKGWNDRGGWEKVVAMERQQALQGTTATPGTPFPEFQPVPRKRRRQNPLSPRVVKNPGSQKLREWRYSNYGHSNN